MKFVKQYLSTTFEIGQGQKQSFLNGVKCPSEISFYGQNDGKPDLISEVGHEQGTKSYPLILSDKPK